ncbi:hypothetical protein [Sorangium sp. So ce861]|uniref:hypothetical protein n=1 Tax=Sorangium sp. So ce861 TaxID=3133323 RepID=UPI003F60509D
MLEQRGFPLATAHEDEITIALHAVLENDLRQKGTVPGFNQRIFEEVRRHCPVVNYNFEKMKTAPDLCFKLREDAEPRRVISAQDALFVECKPVDKSHTAGAGYCDAGLVRFVVGDYAWAMQDALMVAYVRHGRTLDTHLVSAMKERAETLKISSMPRAVAMAQEEERADALRVSRHSRDFPWPDNKGNASSIFVYHAWYRCD